MDMDTNTRFEIHYIDIDAMFKIQLKYPISNALGTDSSKIQVWGWW